MTFEKENFLRTKLVPLFQKLDPAKPPRWGKMSVQQMIEHYTEAVQNASGRLKFENIVTPPGNLQRVREFMMSEKPFRENTKNPLLPEEPPPLKKFRTVQAAIGALHEELIYFFESFEMNTGLITRNPIFGDLNFEQNVQLLHKHALHHLKQFGTEV